MWVIYFCGWLFYYLKKNLLLTSKWEHFLIVQTPSQITALDKLNQSLVTPVIFEAPALEWQGMEEGQQEDYSMLNILSPTSVVRMLVSHLVGTSSEEYHDTWSLG